MNFFVFSVKAFYFSKFHEDEAKHDKLNFKRALTVVFEVKNSTGKFCLNFCKLIGK